MSLQILSIGTALPQHHIAQEDIAQLARSFCGTSARKSRLLPALYRRAGVGSRHSVVMESSDPADAVRQTFYPQALDASDAGPTTRRRMERYEADTGPLAVAAARRTLERASLSPAEVTHLITVSCTGFAAPGVDVTLIRDLGLLPHVSRTQVGFMGCHGALNGLRVARAFAAADPAACILMCAVELCSLHQQYGWNPDRIVANALFADGAAAIVGRWSSETETGGRDAMSSAPLRLLASGSTVIPDSEDLMEWRIGNHGFEMTLSPQVPNLIHLHLRPWLTEWLAGRALTIEQIGSWAIHPGGPRILSACQEAVGLRPEQLATSRSVLAELGNMSSPTVLFILDRLCLQQAPLPCVLLGFGPGLAIEAALVG